MNDTQKGLALPLIIAIISILVLGGVYYIETNNRDAVTDDINNVSRSQNTGLQTYYNSQFKFELKYPNDWYTGSESSKFDQVGYNFDLSFCPASLYANGNCKFEQTSAKKATLFAPILLSVIINGSDMPKAGSNTTVIKGLSYSYRITLNDSAYRDTYNQIVSSFKVTK